MTSSGKQLPQPGSICLTEAQEYLLSRGVATLIRALGLCSVLLTALVVLL